MQVFNKDFFQMTNAMYAQSDEFHLNNFQFDPTKEFHDFPSGALEAGQISDL